MMRFSLVELVSQFAFWKTRMESRKQPEAIPSLANCPSTPPLRFHLPLDFRQLFLSLQLENSYPTPWLQLVSFSAWLGIWLVHHASTKFHKSLYSALCSLFANSNTQCQRADFIDLIWF